MFTCTKHYQDIPFAHRQHAHDGHCALIHGHNWGVVVEFEAEELDECGFVVDFGKLKTFKAYLEKFDHALVLNHDDPRLPELLTLQTDGFARVVLVDSCSSEGLAQHFFDTFSDMLRHDYGERVSIKRVTVTEDSKNSATCYG
jgi:6-pyruvoyltetrahydropterin/6-carboxytetrahydropterin synthase